MFLTFSRFGWVFPDSEEDWMCVTVRQEVKPSTLPFMEEKSCSMLQQSYLTQTETHSKSVWRIIHSLSLVMIYLQDIVSTFYSHFPTKYVYWANPNGCFCIFPLFYHQLQRKRHIGNDIVALVYQEGNTPFLCDVIKSHFLHSFLVVRRIQREETDGTAYQVSQA